MKTHLKQLILAFGIAGFLALLILESGYKKIDLGKMPSIPAGYEIYKHQPSESLALYRLLGVGWNSLDMEGLSPEYRKPEMDILHSRLEAGLVKDMNANLFEAFQRNQSLIPRWMKSRESTTLRGFAATQTRLFYFFGTIYKKDGALMVPCMYWNDDEGIWRFSYHDLEPSYTAGRVTTNTLDKNDYAVVRE